jgi:hypothetical protein
VKRHRTDLSYLDRPDHGVTVPDLIARAPVVAATEIADPSSSISSSSASISGLVADQRGYRRRIRTVSSTVPEGNTPEAIAS